MNPLPWATVALFLACISSSVDAKNVARIPNENPDEGMVMLDDDLSSLDFCKGPIAFTTNTRVQAPVGCWRRVPNGVLILWATKAEAFVPERDIKWLGAAPPTILP